MTQPGMWQNQPGGAGWPGHGPQYPAGPSQPYGQPPPYGPATPHPPQYQPAPQRIPRPSPFAGVPQGDFALDGAVVIGLLATLLLAWTAAQRGYGRPEVIVGCLLSLVAIALPYLSRAGIFGPTWVPAKLRVAKLIAAAPLGICAAIYFVVDAIVGVTSGGPTTFAIAPGAWIAAAVSVLAALPRRSDLLDGGPESARLWGSVLTITRAALLVCAALALVGVLLGTYRSLNEVFELRALILLPAVQAVLLGIWVIAVWNVARAAARGDTAGRLVLAAAGAGALMWALVVAVWRFNVGAAESLHLPFGGFALTMVVALVALSPSLRNPGEQFDAQAWLGAARGVLGLAIIADILLVAQVIADVTMTGALTAVVYTTVIGAGLGAIAADWARQQVTLNPARSRGPVLIASTVQCVAGVVPIVVAHAGANSWEVATGPQVIAASALPAASAAFVTLPKTIRAFFPTPVRTPAPPPTYAAPGTSDPAAAAADPNTPVNVLYALAQQNSAVLPYIASNPAAPQDLLNWLAQSADPQVQAALRARHQ